LTTLRGNAFRAMQIAQYDTDLTDAQWAILQPLLPSAHRRGRPRTCLRRVLNAIFYVVKSGCPWRLLPHHFPPWKTVYHPFRTWSRDGVWSAHNDRLRAMTRALVGKRCRPTAAALDRPTVRSDPPGGEAGCDAAKQTKGRQRFLLVDTLGRVLGAGVEPADPPERAGARHLLDRLLGYFPWLRKLWVDRGFSGPDFAGWVRQRRPGLEVEVVHRIKGAEGFHGLPRRWVVERSFAWLVQNRRRVRDYERTETSAVAWMHVAMIRLMLRRLA